MRLLMIEDEPFIAEAVAEVLRRRHYAVDLVFDGEDGLDYALSGIYDLIILDIMLPKRDGLSVLKEFRRLGRQTPVILLTARGELDDKIRGLDLGADDYLTKPFHTEELLARIRALQRRPPEYQKDNRIFFGTLWLDPHTLKAGSGSRTVSLSIKQSQILELLMQRRNTPVSKEYLIDKVWGYDAEADAGHVETHVSLLRKNLGLLDSDIVLKTQRGIGYILMQQEGDN